MFFPLMASASLYSYYGEIGQKMPSWSERIKIAETYNIANYIGTRDQNVLLEKLLRSNPLGAPTSPTPQPLLNGNNTWTANNTFASTTINGLATTSKSLVIGTETFAAPTNTLSVVGNTHLQGNATTTGQMYMGSYLSGGGNTFYFYPTTTEMIASADTERTTTTPATPQKLKEIKVNYGGMIYANAQCDQDGVTTNAYCYIYVNGVQITSKALTSGSYETINNAYLAVNPGDLVQIYGQVGSSDNIKVKEFRLWAAQIVKQNNAGKTITD